jgi:hypothetical protein
LKQILDEIQHLLPPSFLLKNRVISVAVHLFGVTNGRGYSMLEDAENQGWL